MFKSQHILIFIIHNLRLRPELKVAYYIQIFLLFMIIIEKFQLWEQTKPIVPQFYIVLSSLCFSLQSMTVKLLKNIPATQSLYIRSFITIIILGLYIQEHSIQSYPQKYQNKLLLRGIIGGVGALCWFESLQFLPSSEAQVLVSITPFWTSLMSAYLLKTEQLRMKKIVLIFITLMGVALILRPPILLATLGIQNIQINQPYHLIGSCLALFCSLTQSSVQVLISSLKGSGVHQLVLLQYFSLFTIVSPFLFQIYSPFLDIKTPNLFEAIFLIFGGFAGAGGQIFMNRAVLFGNLNQISLLSQSSVLFNYLFDIAILGVEIHSMSVIGTVIVLTCLTTNILTK
ncbi:hypothetical protein pb186bvf_004702 [Paramecium bursaria]